MKRKDLEFLKALTEAPSPSGFEVPAADILRARLDGVANSIETNVMGCVHATLKGTASEAGELTVPSVMIAGHLDEIGLMVKYISDDGFISFSAIGGIDPVILPGMRLNVYATGRRLVKRGENASADVVEDAAVKPQDAYEFEVIRGVICRKPIHLIQPDDRKKVTPLEKLYIDVGLSGEVAKERIRIGDAVSFGVGFEEFGDGFAVARSFDDKIGVWIAARVLEEVKRSGGARGDLIAVGTVQEEVGLRGGTTSAYSINPTIGISAEVGHATDYPDVEKRQYGEAACGKGPIIARGPNINPILFERLVAAAEKAKAAYQIGPEPRATGTDANPIQLARGGKVAGLISIPLRYMHTPTEVLKLEDLEAAVKILTQFVLDLDENVDFTPR